MPQVVVGLVTYNSLQDLPGCMAGVRAQTYPDLRLVVVDNASSDASADWLESNVPDATLIRNVDNLGFACAHNQILQHCQLGPEDFYLALNPDVHMDTGYVSELKEGLLASGAGWGTGKLRLLDSAGETTPRIYSVGHALGRDGYFFNIGFGIPDKGQFEAGREVFGAPGAAAMYAEPLIDSVALDGKFFDEDFFLYGEDTDVDWRARNAGWRCIYVPTAVADHRGSEAAETLRLEAVVNRYLSALKNARVGNLLGRILPIMVLHVAFRLAFSPRQGLRMVQALFKFGPKMINKRSSKMMTRAEIEAWRAWSEEQKTKQPRTLRDRLDTWQTHR